MTRPLGIQKPILPPATLGVGQYRPTLQLLPLLGSQPLTVLNPALFQGSLGLSKRAPHRQPAADVLSRKEIGLGLSQMLGDDLGEEKEVSPVPNQPIARKELATEATHNRVMVGDSPPESGMSGVVQRALINKSAGERDDSRVSSPDFTEHREETSADIQASSLAESSFESNTSPAQVDAASSPIGLAADIPSETLPLETLSLETLPSETLSAKALPSENLAVDHSPSKERPPANSPDQALSRAGSFSEDSSIEESSTEDLFAESTPTKDLSTDLSPQNPPAENLLPRSEMEGLSLTEKLSLQQSPTESSSSQRLSPESSFVDPSPADRLSLQPLAEIDQLLQLQPMVDEKNDEALQMPGDSLQLSAGESMTEAVSPLSPPPPPSTNEAVSSLDTSLTPEQDTYEPTSLSRDSLPVSDTPLTSDTPFTPDIQSSRATYEQPTWENTASLTLSEPSTESTQVLSQPISQPIIQAPAAPAGDDISVVNEVTDGATDGATREVTETTFVEPLPQPTDLAPATKAGGQSTKAVSDDKPALPTLPKALNPLSTFTPLEHHSLGLKPLLPDQASLTKPVNRTNRESSSRPTAQASPLDATVLQRSLNSNEEGPISSLPVSLDVATSHAALPRDLPKIRPETGRDRLNASNPSVHTTPFTPISTPISSRHSVGEHLSRRAYLPHKNESDIKTSTAFTAPPNATSTEAIETASPSTTPASTTTSSPTSLSTSLAAPLTIQPYPDLNPLQHRPTIHRKASASPAPPVESLPPTEPSPQNTDPGETAANSASPADLEKLANHMYQQLKQRLLHYQERQGHYHRRLG